MILGDLFESGIKRVVDQIRDFVELSDQEFIKLHGISPVTWVKQNHTVLNSIADQYPAIKKYLPAPDAHLFQENVMVENLRKWFKEKWVRFGPDGKIRGDCARGSSKEGKPKCLPQSKAHALGKKGRASAAAKKRREDPNPERRGPAKNVATKVREQGVAETFARPENSREQQAQLLARVYAELYWGNRSITERVRTAQEIFRALESGELDMATLKMEIRALEREYDLDETTDQERQAERNARIIAGEIEDAMTAGQDTVAKQKIKELIRMGYNLDKDGNLQRMGMYEGIFGFSEEELQEKQDACYHKVRSRYKVWPSAYASGALVQCRKKGAANWGTGGKKKK